MDLYYFGDEAGLFVERAKYYVLFVCNTYDISQVLAVYFEVKPSLISLKGGRSALELLSSKSTEIFHIQ